MVDPGARFGVVPTLKQRRVTSSEFLTSNGQNLRQPVGPVLIPQGFPGAGTPAPNANLSPYITPVGRVLTNLYPEPNHVSADNQFNYVLSQLEPTNRLDFKTRVDYNISSNTKAYVRIARESERSRAPVACGGAPRKSRCRRRTSARTSAARWPAASSRC